MSETCLINGKIFEKDFLIYISEFFKDVFTLDKKCIELTLNDSYINDFLKILEFYQKNSDEVYKNIIKLNKYELYFSDTLKKNENNKNIFNEGIFDFKNRVLKIIEIDSENKNLFFKNKKKEFQENIIVKDSGLLNHINDKRINKIDLWDFVKNICILSCKYDVKFLCEECELWLCHNTKNNINIYNLIDEIEWGYCFHLDTYIEFLLEYSKNSIYVSEKILQRNKKLFKILFDKFVLDKIYSDKQNGFISFKDEEFIPIIKKDWCCIPEEYEIIFKNENTAVYNYNSQKNFVLKDNNKYGWIKKDNL
jgi:hypothetical protein